MSFLDKLKIAVQKGLEERAWLAPALTAGVVDETPKTKEMGKRIVCQLANRWQHEAPQHHIHKDLAEFFHKISLRALGHGHQHDGDIFKHKRLKRTLDNLFKSDPIEEEIQRIRLQMSANSRWFEAELTSQFFAQLEPLVQKGDTPIWVSFLLKTSPSDIAILISLVSNEVIQRGWKSNSTYDSTRIYRWMKEEAKLMKLLSFSDEEINHLFSVGDALVDPVQSTIAENPRFCRTSDGRLRLFDKETLADMQRSDQSYRALIATIDNSGPMGIEYIMTALPGDEPDVAEASDQVLRVWLTKFPMINYLALPNEVKKQRELFFHERWLYNVDRFLDRCAKDALPEEVRQVFVLEQELADREEELDGIPDDVESRNERIATLDEEQDALVSRRELLDNERVEAEFEEDEEIRDANVDEIDGQLEALDEELATVESRRARCISYVNLRAEIVSIQSQVDAGRVVRDSLNIEELKRQAIECAQVGIAVKVADQEKWSVLLNYYQDDPAHALTEDQLTALVVQAVDAFVARNYVGLAPEESGKLSQHLATRREMQEEKRFSAAESLRTQATAEGELHQLAVSEVRDPIIRTLFIDIATSSDGSNFCHIIIGACLTAIERPPLEPRPVLVLPESIKDFIDTQDAAYPDKAKESFKQFRV